MSPLRTIAALSVAFGSQLAFAGFSTECDVSLVENDLWLYAKCPDSTGATVESTAFLGNWITNHESVLEWQQNGNHEYSCRDCGLDGATFTCTCQTTFNQWNTHSINLEEHFLNFNGTIQSNFLSEPTVSPRSSVPVPSSFAYSYAPTEDTNCTVLSPWSRNNYNKPIPCNAFTYYVDMPAVAARFSQNPGWGVTAYKDLECQGAVVGKVGLEDGTDCTVFEGGEALSSSVQPLWNSI